jgi:hypothetical protein
MAYAKTSTIIIRNRNGFVFALGGNRYNMRLRIFIYL